MKAQLWSLDFAISMIIFFLSIILVFFSWSYISAQHQEQIELNRVESIALHVSDVLIRSPGVPKNWELGTLPEDMTSVGLTHTEESAKSLGFSSSENVLDGRKVALFAAMLDAEYHPDVYKTIKQIFGIGNYEIVVEIARLEEIDGCFLGYPCGHAPEDSYFIVPIERYAVLDSELGSCFDVDDPICYSPYNKIVRVKVTLYR